MSRSSDQQTPSLSRRPEARGFRVEHLLDEAQRGNLRIPHFQRPLRWRTKNVLELFDSIRRGFPIGDLLLSRGTAEAETVSFGSVSFQVEAQHSALWVVDGQQRLTALVATLLRREAVPRRDYWAVWYDLQTQTFEVLKRREPEPAWIPLNVLSDSVRQLKWIRNWPYAEDHEDLVDRALELGKSVREYEVPAYIVDGADDQVLRVIFTRANTAGIGMRESEIFEALYGKEGDRPIRSAVSRLVDLGFGKLDEDLFLRCVRGTCNPMLTDHVSLESQMPQDSIQRTETAVRRAITTITTWAGIPSFKLMPYRLPLYILAAFYDQFPEENVRVDQLAARWIWRGALSGQHDDSSDANVRKLVGVVRQGTDPQITIAQLIRMLGDMSLNDPARGLVAKIDQKISLNSAVSKTFVLALLAAGPRRKDSTVPLEQITLFEVDEPDEETENSEINRSVMPAESALHSKYYRSILPNESDKFGTDIVVRLADMTPQAPIVWNEYDLSSFLLSEEAVRLASDGKVDEFRECRRRIFQEYLPKFVADRIGDTVDTRPSIHSILNDNPITAAE